jgi:HEPN domain-containing protein
LIANGPIDASEVPTPRDPLVAEWVAKAFADTESAERELAQAVRPNHDSACFHAQQAIEKILKGLIQAQSVGPPYTHNLLDLGDLVSTYHAAWKNDRNTLRTLTFGAIQFRYPGRSASSQEAKDSVLAMRAMFRLALALY